MSGGGWPSPYWEVRVHSAWVRCKERGAQVVAYLIGHWHAGMSGMSGLRHPLPIGCIAYRSIRDICSAPRTPQSPPCPRSREAQGEEAWRIEPDHSGWGALRSYILRRIRFEHIKRLIISIIVIIIPFHSLSPYSPAVATCRPISLHHSVP